MDFLAYEKMTSDQWSAYGKVKITDGIEYSSCGVIEEGSKLTLALREWTNDITREEAWKIAVNADYKPLGFELMENSAGHWLLLELAHCG